MNFQSTQLKSLIQKYQWHMLIGCIGVTLLIQFLTPGEVEFKKPQQSDIELDTIIPKDQSLFPLDLVNRNSISAVLGPFGVVDLYRYYSENNKKLLAQNIKLFRAPKNPESFYALIPESKVSKFIRENDKTFAVIKNRSQTAAKIDDKKKFTRKITIGVSP